jgi:hypothetical protein
VVAAVAAAAAGAILCLLGAALWALVAFSPPADGMTESENMLIASLCCGLPLVGPALVLLLVAGLIWQLRLRKRA